MRRSGVRIPSAPPGDTDPVPPAQTPRPGAGFRLCQSARGLRSGPDPSEPPVEVEASLSRLSLLSVVVLVQDAARSSRRDAARSSLACWRSSAAARRCGQLVAVAALDVEHLGEVELVVPLGRPMRRGRRRPRRGRRGGGQDRLGSYRGSLLPCGLVEPVESSRAGASGTCARPMRVMATSPAGVERAHTVFEPRAGDDPPVATEHVHDPQPATAGRQRLVRDSGRDPGRVVTAPSRGRCRPLVTASRRTRSARAPTRWSRAR